MAYPAKKQTELIVTFPIYNITNGKVISGATITSKQYSIDGGNFYDCSGTVTEIQTSGVYKITLAADLETSGNLTTLKIVSSTENAQDVILSIYFAENTLDEVSDVVDSVDSKVDEAITNSETIISDVSDINTEIVDNVIPNTNLIPGIV